MQHKIPAVDVHTLGAYREIRDRHLAGHQAASTLLIVAGLADERWLIDIEALAAAEEAFLTSTTRDVHPIHAVDGHRLPSAPGSLTQAAAQAFAHLKATEIDP